LKTISIGYPSGDGNGLNGYGLLFSPFFETDSIFKGVLTVTVFYSHFAVTSTIPTELSLLTSLESLGLQENKFDSSATTIPTEFGLLSSLKFLDLQENDSLHGPIPTELGQLSSNLQELLLGGTAVTGTLPTELVLLTNLRTIEAHGELNLLRGSPPAGLCQLPLFETILTSCRDKQIVQFDDCPNTCCYCY
jgi:hypothetical protein